MLLTILTFLIVLSVLVFAHELGHFWTARKFGVKAEEFGFGFPPRMFGVYKDRHGKWKLVWGSKEVRNALDTVYSLNWIPIGGFVKIKGENGDDENDPDSFTNRPIWKRAVILSAGVTMNVILAAILISLGLMIGLPQNLDDGLSPRAKVSNQKIQIIKVLEDSPAQAAGLSMGDIIVSVDNNKFIKIEELQAYTDSNKNKELDYVIKQGQEEVDYKITPVLMEDIGRGGIGVAIVTTGLVKYPWYLAIFEGFKTTFILVWVIIVAFFELFRDIFLGRGISADIAGPVGIATITGQVARMGAIYVLQFTALLSINLAILNFLPIPALDGGRILFLIIEKIKGSPIKREIEAVIHNIGFALLMILVLLVTFRDVAKFGDKFKMLWERIF